MNKPKLKIETRRYKYQVFCEKRHGYNISIVPIGFIVIDNKNKKLALLKARDVFENKKINRVELFSVLKTTYVLSQITPDIQQIIKQKGDIIETEENLHD